jgi:hypothetical protein
MKNSIFLVSVFLFLNSLAYCQSITIAPNDLNSSLNTAKVGTNIVKIEGKSFTDFVNSKYTAGSASLKLIGDPNGSPSLAKSSTNIIEFLHETVSRWSIGDNYSDNSNFIFPTFINSFMIRDNGTSANYIPLEIGKGTNTVTLSNLLIRGMTSSTNDGKALRISTGGNVVAAPDQFLNLGALDLITLGSGTITKDFSGSFVPATTTQAIYAPIHLLDGSKFVRFTVTYLDDSPTSSLMVSLISLTGSTLATIASTTSTNVNSSSNGSMSPSTYTGSLEIDNENKQYYFEIKPRSQTNINTAGNWDSAFLKLVKIVLEYK